MDLQQTLNELFAMTFHAGIKPGLERIKEMCERIDNPQLRFPVVHVAGTNGKGSTCAMIASILATAGYKVGLYTSPHVRSFGERIRINGVPIADADVMRLARPLMDCAKEIGGTFFEVTTAMAFQYFAERRVDVAVIETGLGGRLDATNVVEPFLSVITTIDLDHMEYLGTTLTQIASEKAGIIKAGAPVVIAPQAPEVLHVFRERAQYVGAEMLVASDAVRCEVGTIHPDLTMTVSCTQENSYTFITTDFCGTHQLDNLATAIASVPFLRRLYFIEDSEMRTGLSVAKRQSATLCRMDVVSADPFVVVDVAHNAGGLKALRSTLNSAGWADGSVDVVFGAMADKDVHAMLHAISPLARTLHLCAPELPRSLPVEDLLSYAVSQGLTNAVAHSSVRHATMAAKNSGAAVICGSFHVADEALSAL